MIENKNALAELAKVMDEPVDMASIHNRGLVVLNAKQFSAYQKAQRIVAELAKVDAIKRKLDSQMPTESIDVWSKTMNEWVEADRHVVDRCRAIAEEGN